MHGFARLPRKFRPPIRVRGVVNDFSGYGLHLQYTVQHLKALGYSVETVPVGDVKAPFPEVIPTLNPSPSGHQRELVILPSSHKASAHQWVFSMYETTRLPKRLFGNLNNAHAVIVPSRWVAQNFSAQGIAAPLHVVPLGFNEKVFYPAWFVNDLFTFGAAGNPSLSVAARKNIDMVVEAFTLAFPTEADVRLKIKVLPQCVVSSNADPRIEIIRDVLDEQALGDWTRSLNAFVSASRGEAFGFFNVQAMACGVPVICCDFGGVTDYFSDSVGYPVDYDLVEPHNGHYENGLWAEPSLASLVEQMRRAYEDRDELRRKAELSVRRVADLTWEKSVKKLETVLKKTHFWEKYEVVHADSDEDKILRFYRCAIQNPKGHLPDLTYQALSNTPRGLGDTLILSHLPAAGAAQGKPRFIHANPEEHLHFSTLMKFNPYYMPKPDAYGLVMADELYQRHDCGNGHLIQRLQRAFGLEPVLKPKSLLHLPMPKYKGRVVMHFEAGGPHSGWQRTFLHPRARQLYPEGRSVIQEFVNAHPELEFYQMGKEQHPFKRVNSLPENNTLEDTIRFMATCDFFIGIISGPMHIAAALDIRSIVVINFPPAPKIFLPTLVDIDQVESEWFYPQNVHLHQESEGPQVKRLSYRALEDAYQGQVYPYWDDRFLGLIHEKL